MNRICATAAALCLLAPLALAGSGASADRPLVIGSKIFTENRLLAEMMAQLVEERTDIAVERRINLGGSLLTFNALTSGEIDLYPEYTGTLWYGESILAKAQPPSSALQAFAVSREELAQRWNLHLLPPFGFNNTYAMGVHKDVAERLQLKTISDLAGKVSDLRIVVSHEFLQRPDGWGALVDYYGLQRGSPRGIEHGLIYHALAAGEADLTDCYSTDGKLLDYPVTLLEDNLSFFPPYQGVPLISGKALKRWPELRPLLAELAFTLDDDKMRALNHDAETDGDYARVAHSFLQSQQLIGTRSEAEGATTGSGSRASDPWRNILDQIGQHLMLSLFSVLLAVLIALPGGILLSRRPGMAAPMLWVAGMVQTVPALALFAFLITLPGFGLGTVSAMTAITLYAILPVLRNVCTGINEVDPELIDTVRSLGVPDHNILLQVELPLAMPTIMAGIRTAAVISVGMATLAAFVGAGGLGDLILTGLQLVNTPLILAGAIPAAVLALLTDLSLAALERFLSPKGLRSN